MVLHAAQLQSQLVQHADLVLPKQLITLVLQGLLRSTKRRVIQSPSDEGSTAFIYPHGTTLTVSPPALAFLSSGRLVHPASQPLGAINDCRIAYCADRVDISGFSVQTLVAPHRGLTYKMGKEKSWAMAGHLQVE